MRRIWDLTDDEIRISARLRNDHTDLPGLYVFRDGSWIAYCDLPGGTGCGPTPEDAVAEMREFIAERLKPRLSKEQRSEFEFGSSDAELDRTAEMFLDLCAQGKPHFALWLIHDSNRFDPSSLKFLCERVEIRHREMTNAR